MPAKHRQNPQPATELPLSDRDEAIALCNSISALAKLLGMAGAADDLEGDLVAEIAWMIRAHADKLHAKLAQPPNDAIPGQKPHDNGTE